MNNLTDDQLSAIDDAIDTVMPEATEYVEALNEIRFPTTQDNYGTVMTFLSKLPDGTGPVFLLALVRAGYPASTGEQLARVMGYRHAVSDLIVRESTR